MLVLCIDIGGSGLKGALVNERQEMVSDRLRVETPQPAQPEPVVTSLLSLLAPLQGYDRVAVGFPGVVVEGTIRTAVNLHPDWHGFPLAEVLGQKLGVPTRVANDADVQGYGVIRGEGVELVLTLGTGMGSALFVNGTLVPNLEMPHHPFRKGDTYEEQLGDAGRKRAGNEKWNRRLLLALQQLQDLFSCQRIYLGGGNGKKIAIELPEHVEIVSNQAGIYGGVNLWKDVLPASPADI